MPYFQLYYVFTDLMNFSWVSFVVTLFITFDLKKINWKQTFGFLYNSNKHSSRDSEVDRKTNRLVICWEVAWFLLEFSILVIWFYSSKYVIHIYSILFIAGREVMSKKPEIFWNSTLVPAKMCWSRDETMCEEHANNFLPI